MTENPGPSFSQNQKNNAKRREGEIGAQVGFCFRYSRPLLNATGLTQLPYSRGLLKAPEGCFLINLVKLIVNVPN